jgi:iron complex outermembrane receptor protein
MNMTPIKAGFPVCTMLDRSSVSSRPQALFVYAITCLASVLSLPAQTAAKPDAGKEDDTNKILQLSKFEVTSTQDHGYIYNNSAGALKTSQPLLDIPQVDIVVTRDMLNDIRFTTTSDVMRYFGIPHVYVGEVASLRGGGILAFQDEMPTGGLPYADNGTIDSYEIIKGAAQVLYLSNGLSGILLKNTKKPLPYTQNEIQMSVDSFGSVRAMADFTGPLGTLGDAKISYRFIAIDEQDNPFFVNVEENHRIFMPQFQVDFKNTTIRAYYQRSEILHMPNANGLVTADGQLFVGNGLKYSQGMAKGTMEQHNSDVAYLSIDTRLSDNWQNRFKAASRNSHRFGANALPIFLDLDLRTVGYIARLNNLSSRDINFMDDIQGNYHIGSTENIDAFGFVQDTSIFYTSLWGGAVAATPAFPTTYYSIDDRNALVNIVAPRADQYDGSKVANANSRNNSVSTKAYWAHSININKYVTLTGGFTYAKVDTYGIDNISVHPWTASSVVVDDQILHRYGVVIKPTKDVSIYALESTTFNAVGGGETLFDGSLPPSPIGKNKEIGFKTALFDGKLNLNFALFDMTLSGITKTGGIRPDGSIYYVTTGFVESKGCDGNIGLTLVPGWELVGTFYHTEKSFSNSQPEGSWSVFTNYQFPKGSPLAGLAIGCGTGHFTGQYLPLAGLYTYSKMTPFEIANGIKLINTGTPVKLFASYKYNKHWTFRLSCDNAFDEVYVAGAQIASLLDCSPPRSFTFESIYRF